MTGRVATKFCAAIPNEKGVEIKTRFDNIRPSWSQTNVRRDEKELLLATYGK